MSTIFMVFGLIFVSCSVILLSRKSVKRSFRQRRKHAVLVQVRRMTPQ